MINLKTYLTTGLSHSFKVAFTALFVVINISVLSINTIYIQSNLTTQNRDLTTMIEHLVRYTDQETVVTYLEHYGHTHDVYLTYETTDATIFFQTTTPPKEDAPSYPIYIEEHVVASLVVDNAQSNLFMSNLYYILSTSIIFILLYVFSLIYFNKKIVTMHHSVLKDIDNVVSSIQSLKFNSAYQFDDILYIAYAFENSYEQLKQQQMRHLDKTQMLAHDIKTPLTIIKALIDGIIHNKIDLDKATMDSLNEETHRVTHLIESIIEDSEAYPLERVDVSAIMTKTMERFKPLYVRKGVHLKTQIEGGVQMVTNPVDIERMVDHLLQNSLKYTPKNKQVVVELTTKPLRIVVSDQGIGFNVDDLENTSKKTSHSGTGIGLRIVDSIVHRYGGELKIESSLNHGTKVCITFDS